MPFACQLRAQMACLLLIAAQLLVSSWHWLCFSFHPPYSLWVCFLVLATLACSQPVGALPAYPSPLF